MKICIQTWEQKSNSENTKNKPVHCSSKLPFIRFISIEIGDLTLWTESFATLTLEKERTIPKSRGVKQTTKIKLKCYLPSYKYFIFNETGRTRQKPILQKRK